MVLVNELWQIFLTCSKHLVTSSLSTILKVCQTCCWVGVAGEDWGGIYQLSRVGASHSA